MPPPGRTTSAEFDAAAEATRKFTVKPSNDDLLKLYGLFKQATQNPTFEASEKPGMFDMKGKAKRSAWEAVSTKDPAEAEQEYITLVEQLKTTYKYDENKVPE